MGEESGLRWPMVETLCRLAERGRRYVDGNGSGYDGEGDTSHCDWGCEEVEGRFELRPAI